MCNRTKFDYLRNIDLNVILQKTIIDSKTIMVIYVKCSRARYSHYRNKEHTIHDRRQQARLINQSRRMLPRSSSRHRGGSAKLRLQKAAVRPKTN